MPALHARDNVASYVHWCAVPSLSSTNARSHALWSCDKSLHHSGGSASLRSTSPSVQKHGALGGAEGGGGTGGGWHGGSGGVHGGA